MSVAECIRSRSRFHFTLGMHQYASQYLAGGGITAWHRQGTLILHSFPAYGRLIRITGCPVTEMATLPPQVVLGVAPSAFIGYHSAMQWLLRLLTRIHKWWRSRRRLDSFSGVVRIDSSADPAADLHAGRLVLIGPREKPKWLRFVCPCQCGDVIALNLMASHSPRWTVKDHEDGTITVTPSIDAGMCGSHFWIQRNRVVWT